MTESNTYIEILSRVNRLTEPAIKKAIAALKLQAGSTGLDAACGIGYHTRLLAEAVAPGGMVTGIDFSPEHLDYAKAGSHPKIIFQQGDINHFDFADNTFDWVWASDAILPGPREQGFPVENPLEAINEIKRIVKPGGTIAILFWTSQKLLPGYPLLEAKLNATRGANIPATENMDPLFHHLRGLDWLNKAGLGETRAETFTVDIAAPLDDPTRKALDSCFSMLWGMSEKEVSPDDWTKLSGLCNPLSPDYILDQSGYYGFINYTLFSGKEFKPGAV